MTSVRARLTVWHTAVLALIVAIFAGGSYLFVRARLYAELDAQLGRELAIIDRIYREEPGELTELPGDRGYLFFQIAENAALRHQTDGWKQVGFAGATTVPASWAASDGTWYRLQAFTAPAYRIAAAVDETSVRHIVSTFGTILLFGIPFALAAALAGGYFLAGRVLAPVGAMADKAQRIGAESLDERLPVADARDEFGRLAGAFNDTLTRLQDAFARLRRFTADASHELRTPLTVMRSVGEVALQSKRETEHYRDVIGSMLEEVDRLTTMVDNLLLLTRADSGAVSLAREPIDLGEFTRGVTDHLRVLAEEKHQMLNVDAPPGIEARVDPRTLRMALANLIHNAIKYTPASGGVSVAVRPGMIEVRDTGPGIAPEHQELVFDRFYRIDPSRASNGGTGLGLAIARWAAQANGGRIELESAGKDGSLFRIVLPN